MTRMVQLAVAGDINEAEEIQEILSSAGIASELQSALDGGESLWCALEGVSNQRNLNCRNRCKQQRH